MGTSAQLIELIKGQVGTVGGAKYWQKVYGWSGNGLPFCAVGVSWALAQTGTKANYFPSTVAFDRRDMAKIGDAWVDRYNLKPGDIFSTDWDGDGGGDHVGFIVEVLGYGVYRTIEFNVSNMVDYRTRYASDIIGGIRPRYSGAAPSQGVPSKVHVDGVFGPKTKAMLQAALQRRGFYRGYALDGVFGHYSKLALQQYLQSKGYYSGYALDGDFAYYSVRALQQHLRKLGYFKSSLRLDGKWGYWTTCGLQQALNAGKF